VLLSARRVVPTGREYGLDMTDEMLALARENQRKAGVENVEPLKGENTPLPDDSVACGHARKRANISATGSAQWSGRFSVARRSGMWFGS